MIVVLQELLNYIKVMNKTPKLSEIKLDENGDKEIAVLTINTVKIEVSLDILKAYAENNSILNCLIHNDEVYVLPNVHNFVDIKDKQFGLWTVKEYLGAQKWLCECECGTRRAVVKASLMNGKSTGCGHNTNAFVDLTDKQIEDWKVKRYLGDGFWECDCKCGNTNVRVKAQSLVNGKSKSCGHATNMFENLSGRKFGKWKVIDYVGAGTRLWNCECECSPGVIHQVDTQSLLDGRSTSCHQCNHSPRKDWQNEAIKNEQKFNSILANACNSLGRQLYTTEVAEIFDISHRHAAELIIKYFADCYIIPADSTISKSESDIVALLKSFNLSVVQHDRTILNGKELDLYLPDFKIAIEFNGTYWHDAKHKPIDYHFNKTKACEENDIRLIHIFEHEWINKKQQIINLLQSAFNIDCTTLYARETAIKQISTQDAAIFCNKYHIQGTASCQLAFGLFHNDILIEVMTFGKPRFNTFYEYELIRLCSKPGYKVVGGASKLFTHFVKTAKPTSVISYCDLSKFTGKVYESLQMQFDGYTTPGYVYVKTNTFDSLNRLQCTKQKLIAEGYGTSDMTEEQIMESRGYLKVYNCGNARYVYRYKEDSTK